MTTVSRALNGHAGKYRISQKTELAVRKAAQEAHFVPNQLARGLRLKKTLTIGLIIPDISNPFFAAIAHQVTLGTHKHGYSVVLCDSQETVEQEMQSIGVLRSRHVEGIVMCPVGRQCEHLVELHRGGVPLVLVDRVFPGLPVPHVGSDNLGGAREATNFLIESGHRRIACLQGLRGTSPNESRVQGYREALASHRIAPDESLIVGDSFGEQSGYIETKRLLQTQQGVTAILALSNLIALGALRALAEENLRVPEDISIIAFDDQPYSALLATPMTSVAQSTAEMGEIAVKLLFDQINSAIGETGGGILLPTTLVVRRSVKKLS